MTDTCWPDASPDLSAELAAIARTAERERLGREHGRARARPRRRGASRSAASAACNCCGSATGGYRRTGVRRDDRADLGDRRGDRGRQDAGEAAAGGGRAPRAGRASWRRRGRGRRGRCTRSAALSWSSRWPATTARRHHRADRPRPRRRPRFARRPRRMCEVLVEAYVPGKDYRVLVVDGRVVAAAELQPAAVTGDGASTIAELVAVVNADPARGEGHYRPLTRLMLGDDASSRHLAAAGPAARLACPAAGEVVRCAATRTCRPAAPARTSPSCVHPEVAELCRRAAAVVGLDVCGIDLRLADIGAAPLPRRTRGARPASSRSTPAPGLRMHLAPDEGTARATSPGRSSTACTRPARRHGSRSSSVTGTNGKTTTVRMIAHMLGQDGLRTGMSTHRGRLLGGRLRATRPTRPARARRRWCWATGPSRPPCWRPPAAASSAAGLGYDRPTSRSSPTSPTTTSASTTSTTVDDLVEHQGAGRRGDQARRARRAERRRPARRRSSPTARRCGTASRSPLLRPSPGATRSSSGTCGSGGVALLHRGRLAGRGAGPPDRALLPVARRAGRVRRRAPST